MKAITLTIGDTDIRFEVKPSDYEAFQDDMTMTKKSVPSKRLLKATVVAEDRKKLDPYIDEGHALEIAGTLIEEYSGELKVLVKNSTSGSSD